MNNIEKIKAEIERRVKELDEQIVDIYDSKAVLRKDELQRLLSFISTLESEKPMQEELEDEISKSIENLEGCSTKIDGNPEYHLISDEDLREFARHFAKWQYQKDRGEFAKIKAKTWQDGFDDCREQMMKEAVEGFIFQSEDYYPKELVARYDGELKHGDKVRVIVLPKEDEK